MERKLSFFQAFQLVHSKRYVINLDAIDIQALIREEKLRQKEKGGKEHFQCICGLNKWTLLLPLDNSEVVCNCQIGDTSCPNYGCGKFCEDMTEKLKSSWRHASIKWGRTIKDNVQTSFDYLEDASSYHRITQEFKNSYIEEKPWKVFRCRRCMYLCYAENTQDPTDIFITTNIPHIVTNTNIFNLNSTPSGVVTKILPGQQEKITTTHTVTIMSTFKKMRIENLKQPLNMAQYVLAIDIHIDEHVFSLAQREVFKLMKNDSFQRFKKTVDYLTFINAPRSRPALFLHTNLA